MPSVLKHRCPECGSDLVERVNRKTQESFLGCTRWPECTKTMPLPADILLRRQGAEILPGFG